LNKWPITPMCCIVVFDYSPFSTAQSIPASEKVNSFVAYFLAALLTNSSV